MTRAESPSPLSGPSGIHLERSSNREFFPGQQEVGLALSEAEVKKRKEALSRSIVNTNIGFDKWLRESTKDNDFIIDGYFYRPPRPDLIESISEEEALPEIKKNIGAIDELGLENLPPEWQIIRANQVAIYVYRQEKRRAEEGERLSEYREFVERVSGFAPELIPVMQLEQDLGIAIELLERTGEQFDGNSPNSFRMALRRRNERTRLNSPEEVEEEFRLSDSRNRFRLSEELVGIDVSKVKFDFVWVEEFAFWRMFEDIGLEGMKLRGNWHPRHRDKWTRQLAGFYGRHEPPHFIQAFRVRQRIRSGEIDSAAGLLIYPGPGGYQFEGIAQVAGDICSYEETVDEKLVVALYRLEKYAIANGLLLVEEGNSIEDVARDIRKYVPASTIEEIKTLLKEGTTKPEERAYLPIYGRSDYDLMQLYGKFQDGMVNWLPYWFSNQLTPQQVLNPPVAELKKYAQ